MEIKVPELSLVLLVGASGSGKSSFAARHFLSTEVLSSDYCRGLVSDDENSQEATADAFDVLHYIAEKRLKRGRLTVIDATNVRADDRKSYLRMAREYHLMPVAIVLNMPEKLCHERNQNREDRNFGSHVVRNQSREVRRSVKRLKREGFRYVYELNSPEDVEAVSVVRQPMWTDKRTEHGPFDIVGDVHGCFDELKELLEQLGYRIAVEDRDGSGGFRYAVTPPEGRKAFFVGDLVDRGPASNECLRLAMDMVEDGVALCVPGNHEAKLYKKLIGKNVKLSHGLAETLEQLEPETPDFIERVKGFVDGLVSHFVLDDGKLVVAHAGMKEEYQGRGSGKVRAFALFGETTGETDEFGLPIRYPWAQDYKGKALVVYGHTPVPEAEFINNTICIDTGCVFGGKLTALRYPEKELVSVPARQTYYERIRPAADAQPPAGQFDDVLSIQDVLGKHHISTQFNSTVIIREGNTLAAIEAISRFGVNPRWLTYLPPTMSPPEVSSREDCLEHPEEAFDYYRKNGVSEVICEEKHMGSRCIAHICKNPEAARKHFRTNTEDFGICYTRTGRRFFNDGALETEFLDALRQAVTDAGVWEELGTDWLTLDCELMPWSLKAMELIRQQYAATGCSAINALQNAAQAMAQAGERGIDLGDLPKRINARLHCANRFVGAYRPYCWTVSSLSDIKLAPFHVMASEDRVHADKDHLWHMQMVEKLAKSGPNWLIATPYKLVDLQDQDSVAGAIGWWADLTARGGEGMVVKPKSFSATGQRGLLQPAIKCRGPAYLRIIYGMDYDLPQNLERLKNRNLSAKRRMAIKEYMLGIEGLTRFVDKQPLQRIHECALGVLALESDPVDPRL